MEVVFLNTPIDRTLPSVGGRLAAILEVTAYSIDESVYFVIFLSFFQEPH